jgi:nucleoside-diphosphate-sugar epimerase
MGGKIMKNILVIGAHGQTGQEVIKQLAANENMTPIAGVRSQAQVNEFEHRGIQARLVDVRKSVEEIKARLNNVDAIVITIAGGWMVDLDGKVKVYQAAEQAGVKRVVLVSAGAIQHFHDDKRLPWMDEWEEYSAAMYYADMILLHSKLDYTIIRPENLTNDEGTGKVRIGDYLPHDYISRANVASVIVASLENDQTIRKAFDVEDGSMPVKEALNSLR